MTMRIKGRNLGLSLVATTAILAGQGCYKLADDCALNLCAPLPKGTTSGGDTGGTTASTSGAGGMGTGGMGTGGMGTGGVGGNPVVSCDPGQNTGAVANDCGVFVSNAGSDTGDGTKAKPFRTLTLAIEHAANGTLRVYACAGEFDETVTVPAGLSLFGGLACNDGWSHDGVQRTALVGLAGQIPLRLAGGGQVTTIADFTVQAASAAVTGGSSIAVSATDATATFTRCDFLAGDAMDGEAGVSGGAQLPQGNAGTAGAVACGNKLSPAVAPLGGVAGSNACGGETLLGGQGGLGGLAVSGSGKDGEMGDFGGGGTLGIGDKAPLTCSNGGAGTAGQGGTLGAGGVSVDMKPGTIDQDGYHGFDGFDGQPGVKGTSGGGGGGARAGLQCNGAAGGGGGAGGCGGNAGSKGKAGGSSLALLSINAVITLAQVKMTVGHGGDGGVGGDGQFGQPGGAGGLGGQPASGVSGGCAGGAGGPGGNGGPAGGGSGGHAAGIAYIGAAPQGDPMITLSGKPGSGGLGGSNGLATGGAGAAGQVAPTLAF
jgi:hypothetical protein